MPRPAQVLTVLIASPGDVARQRDVIQREVEDWNRGRISKDLGIRLEVARWELDAVPELGRGDGQEVINRQLLEEADTVVAIFHARLGTATSRAPSGTAEELDAAVKRGLPVHVFVDVSAIPRDHDAEQLKQLDDYLTGLRGQGLLGEVSSDDDLARQVRRALDLDVAEHLRLSVGADPDLRPSTSVAPDVRWRDRLEQAVDHVLDLPELDPSQPLNGSSDWLLETFPARREAILAGVTPLLRLVVDAVRTGDTNVNAVWMDMIPTLAPNPRAGGLTRLVDLLRAAGILLFHMGGLAACAAGDDALVGRLLSPLVRVDDPSNGPRPAVVSLRAEIAFPDGWPSRELRGFLVPLLSETVGRRSAERAWERWAYLCSVAITYFGATLEGVWLDHPYLLVSGHHMGALDVEAAAPVKTGIAENGASHPLLAAGLCEGSADLFGEAAQTFESNYGQWASRRDWESLPPGGGQFPSGPHYPGER